MLNQILTSYFHLKTICRALPPPPEIIKVAKFYCGCKDPGRRERSHLKRRYIKPAPVQQTQSLRTSQAAAPQDESAADEEEMVEEEEDDEYDSEEDDNDEYESDEDEENERRSSTKSQ
jgi:hypothetical protein